MLLLLMTLITAASAAAAASAICFPFSTMASDTKSRTNHLVEVDSQQVHLINHTKLSLDEDAPDELTPSGLTLGSGSSSDLSAADMNIASAGA